MLNRLDSLRDLLATKTVNCYTSKYKTTTHLFGILITNPLSSVHLIPSSLSSWLDSLFFKNDPTVLCMDWKTEPQHICH